MTLKTRLTLEDFLVRRKQRAEQQAQQLEAHRNKWEPKLWVMFDRARKDKPDDYLLSWAILMEIDRLNAPHNPDINQRLLQSC